MEDLYVKVYRYFGNEEGYGVYDGYYYSNVYAIDEGKMLVYDDGSNSSDDDICEHFDWVCFGKTYYDNCEGRTHSIIEIAE